MKKIKIMDIALANIIAAGEVVERPASVIKELLENAIDANATHIKVEVEQVGIKEIVVTDNGDGMSLDDLRLAVLPHATSKVFKKEDLNHLKTLGFRGEALPSIASVSRLEIQTRTNDETGYFIKVVDSKLYDEGSIGMNRGTKVIVSDLFYNTPARFKYIRSENAERNAIIEIFEKIALSHPNISFELYIDEVLVKSTLGNNSYEALIDHIFGRKTSIDLKTIDTYVGKIKISAYLVSPKYVRSRRNDVNVFINNRYVRNYAISQSIIEGYKTFLMTHKYPIALIYLNLDPSLVDVNIHPQKLEVKLANELMFSYQLTPLVKRALESGNLTINEPLQKLNQTIYKPDPTNIFELLSEVENTTSNVFNEEVLKEEFEKFPFFDYIGTLLGTYLLFQNDEGLFMVDQHAAAERVRYEYYRYKVGEMKSNSYELLIPRPLLLVDSDFNIINDYIEQFKLLGFAFVDNQLTKHPAWLRDHEIDIAIESMINQLNENGLIDLAKLRNELAKDVACKGAIKANQQLSRNEIYQLINDLRVSQNPYTCPHGRPVMIKLSTKDIEKMFKRIV